MLHDARGVAARVKPIGVLLAAGRGRRLGGGKSLLPWPPGQPGAVPMVRAARTVLDAVCDRIVLVVGDRADEVARAAGVDDADRVVSDPDAPMLASIQAGIDAAMTRHPGADVLLHLADVPGVDAETVRAVLEVAREHPGRAIMPEFEGDGGHPVLVPPSIGRRILALDPDRDGGLRAWWTEDPEIRVRWPVPDPGCRRDMDTPRDLDVARRSSSPARGA